MSCTLQPAASRPETSDILHRRRIAAEIVAGDDLGLDAELADQRAEPHAQRLHAHQVDLACRAASARRIRGSRWASPAARIHRRRCWASATAWAWGTSRSLGGTGAGGHSASRGGKATSEMPCLLFEHQLAALVGPACTRDRNDMPSRLTLSPRRACTIAAHVADHDVADLDRAQLHQRRLGDAVGGADADGVVARPRIDAEPRRRALAQRDRATRRCRPGTRAAGRRRGPRPGNGRCGALVSTTLRAEADDDTGAGAARRRHARRCRCRCRHCSSMAHGDTPRDHADHCNDEHHATHGGIRYTASQPNGSC